jgi:S-formylglutathione hydrolase
MLVDQGLDDNFYHQQKLTKPLEEVALEIGYKAEFRYHLGYDHSYFFIASLIEEHLRFHAQHLCNN